MPFGIGIWEMLILLLVLLLVFGPKRLPEMGRQLGRGMREFKETISGDKDDEPDVVAFSTDGDDVSELVVIDGEPVEVVAVDHPSDAERREAV